MSSQDDIRGFTWVKNDLTTGTWQVKPGCPIIIILLATSDVPYGEVQREWGASVLLIADSLLMGTRISTPVLEDLVRILAHPTMAIG